MVTKPTRPMQSKILEKLIMHHFITLEDIFKVQNKAFAIMAILIFP